MSEQPSELILLDVRNDAGPFEPLGTQFKCNGSPWNGKTVASPIAFYLLKKARSSQAYGGGVIGLMLSSALSKDDHLSTCTAADLPAPVRGALDPKSKLGPKEVVIIPKPTISRVTTARFNNKITIHAGADKFALATTLFRGAAKRRALLAMGWILNTPLSPTAAPVHDMRTQEERAKAAKPLWLKAVVIAGAILLFIAVVALKILADH